MAKKSAKSPKQPKAPKAPKQPKQPKKRMPAEEDDHEDDDDAIVEEDCSKLALPSSRVTLMLRKALIGKRFAGDNGVFATGVIEHLVNAIIVSLKKASGSSSAAGKPKRVDYKTLVHAVRSHPDLSRIFAAYVFSPGGSSKLKVPPKIFLNKRDREIYDVKRAAEEKARAKSRKVPAVDEA